MTEKAKQDRNYYVVKSNALIQKSRFSLSLQAQRCLLFAISRIKFSDQPSTEYSFAIKDICEACGIDMKTHGDYYNVMKAEFYREIGDMETAKDILDSVVVEDAFLKQIVSSIRERLEINNCEVFKIQSS